ncbi:MAG: PilZ domain-containing protein [Desulfuromonadales bacterium]|nr:PilZ domain-containing protein [Desulfuromonadales bacterium]
MDNGKNPKYPVEQKDLRSNLRVPLIVEKLPCGDGRKTLFGYARNISCGGVFIATVSPRETGEQFDLQVTFPPPEPFVLKCRCEVVWKRRFQRGGKFEPGMGLRFLDLPEESCAALERWLKRLNVGVAP